MKDNIDRLLDALEHTENYTDDEIGQMLADPKACEVFDMLHRTADASTPVPEINLDEEWRRFAAKRPKRRAYILRRLPFMASRNAAAVVLALVGTLAVVAATIGVTHYIGAKKETAQTQQTEPQTMLAEVNVALSDTLPAEAAPQPETILFKGKDLETILTRIAEYYGASVKFNQDYAKTLQLYFEWNQALPLREVVDQLNNFEQINITLIDRVLTVK